MIVFLLALAVIAVVSVIGATVALNRPVTALDDTLTVIDLAIDGDQKPANKTAAAA